MTRPWAHLHPNHGSPSASDTVSPIRAKDLPALDGPAKSILCPWRSTPSISGGASSGGSSHVAASVSGSGRSSFCSSSHSRHSFQLARPIDSATSHCLRPARMAPGMRDRRDGFLFWVSSFRPLSAQVRYRKSTRFRYSS